MKTTAIWILGGLIWSAFAALGAEPAELATLREFYQKKVAEIDANLAKEQTAPLIEKYDAALARLEDAVANSGDLSGLVAVQKERERAKKAQGIADSDLVEKPEKLAELQKSLAAAQELIAKNREAEVAKVRQIYLERLEAIKIDLTKQKRVDDALAVAAEIEKIAKEQPQAAIASNGSNSEPENASDDEDLSGVWELVRPEDELIVNVTLTKVEPIPEGEPPLYRMTPSSLGGEYVLEGRRLTKLKRQGDAYTDIIWQRRGKEFVNQGSDYADWKMRRPAPPENPEAD